jgi:hypothetical protein
MSAWSRGLRILSLAVAGALLPVLSICLSGCNRDLPPDEYGTVIHEIPPLPEAQKPFEMPKLGPPLTEEQIREVKRMH